MGAAMDHAASDDATTGADEYQARLARAEAEVRDLQRRVERLENQHSLASQPEHQPSGDHHQVSSAAAQGQLAKHKPGSDPIERKQHKIVIMIRLDDIQSADGCRRLAAHVFVHAPEELRDKFRVEGNPLDELLGSTRDRIIELGVDRVLSPDWDRATLTWHPTDFGQFDRAAALATNLQDRIHVEAGQWVAQMASHANVPAPVPFGDGTIVARVIPLPTDRPLTLISEVVDLAGVAVGLVTGHVPLAITSFKSLVHKQLVHSVANGIKRSFSEQTNNERTPPGGSPHREPKRIPAPKRKGRGSPPEPAARSGGSPHHEPERMPVPEGYEGPGSYPGTIARSGGSPGRGPRVKRTPPGHRAPGSERKMPPPGTRR